MSKTLVYQSVDSDRIKHIKKNRQVQLQRWIYLENEYLKKQSNGIDSKILTRTKRIEFNKDIILLEAISRNDIIEVKQLLDEGVNPNAATVDGLTGLHQCAIEGSIEVAALLLKYKANVNALDSDLWTPLHAAATCNNDPMCILFCQYGADLLALNTEGNMPYEVCEVNSTLNIIENEMSSQGITQQQIDDARLVPEQKMLHDLLSVIRNKGDINAIDSQGAAPIHVACCLGYCEVVQTLVEAGANFSLPDKDGWLPIHLAACWNHVDIVEILVVFGVDINIRNSSGETIFDLCEAEIRDRLLFIKENLIDIRKNYTFSRIPSCKSIRRSRGSSVRRTSVRQKNMLSKNEAKGEFIALAQTMPSPPGDSRLAGVDQLTNIPMTIEEDSDVDSNEVDVKVPKVTVNSLKSEDHSNKRKISHSNKINNAHKQPLANTESHPSILSQSTVTRSPSPPPIIETKSTANRNSDNHRTDDIMLSNMKPVLRPVESVEALDKPRYVFSSSTENWSNAAEKKNRRRHKCCNVV